MQLSCPSCKLCQWSCNKDPRSFRSVHSLAFRTTDITYKGGVLVEPAIIGAVVGGCLLIGILLKTRRRENNELVWCSRRL